MDELEFESRLSARLHHRFDGLHPSLELRAGVDQVLATRPEPIGIAVLRGRRRELGWGALVAAGLIVALALSNGSLGGPFRPGAPSASPSSSGAASTWRDFIVVAPAGYEPSADQGLAADVLIERIRALLFNTNNQEFSGTGHSAALWYRIPQGGPSDDSIRTVLRAPGDLAFMSLPAMSTDGSEPAIGQNPPANAQTLFGWDGIASATVRDTDPRGPVVLTFTLQPAAAEAFRTFTATHVGEAFAIVIDDDIAFLPTITEPISDGRFEVSNGEGVAESAAIIAGGRLPDSWIIPIVPEVMSPSDIESGIEFQFGRIEPLPPQNVDITITSAELDAVRIGQRWTAIWRMKMTGLAGACPSPLPSDERGTCRWTDPSTVHVIDAETGDWLGTDESFPSDTQE